MLKVILIAVGALVVFGLTGLALIIWLIIKLTRGDCLDPFGSGNSSVDTSYAAPPAPWDKSFARAGDQDLPHAIRLKGKIYRWQGTSHVHRGPDFHKMFEDGPWKWDAQGRFAGKSINCGHYFGVSVAAATQEAAHYGIDVSNSELIELEGSSSRILDLTHPDVIRQWFEAHVDNHQVISHSIYKMFQELIEQGSGGNSITDYFGLTAKRLGYDGILFYSARVMKEWAEYNFNRNLEGLEAPVVFWEFRTKQEHVNIVFFSGARLISGIGTAKIGHESPLANPYFGRDADQLEADLKHAFGAEYQQERDRFTLTRPRYEDS